MTARAQSPGRGGGRREAPIATPDGTVADGANQEAVDGSDVLAKLVALPVSTWRYEWERKGTRHLGPMAQDFVAAFHLGTDDQTIAMVDMAGVLVVAVQGLHRELQAIRTELQSVRAELDAARQLVAQ